MSYIRAKLTKPSNDGLIIDYNKYNKLIISNLHKDKRFLALKSFIQNRHSRPIAVISSILQSLYSGSILIYTWSLVLANHSIMALFFLLLRA